MNSSTREIIQIKQSYLWEFINIYVFVLTNLSAYARWHLIFIFPYNIGVLRIFYKKYNKKYKYIGYVITIILCRVFIVTVQRSNNNSQYNNTRCTRVMLVWKIVLLSISIFFFLSLQIHIRFAVRSICAISAFTLLISRTIRIQYRYYALLLPVQQLDVIDFLVHDNNNIMA